MEFVDAIAEMESVSTSHHKLSLSELQEKTIGEYVYLLNKALEAHAKIKKENGGNKRR